MGKATIRFLRCVAPEKRLIVAAYIFWATVALGVYCTMFVATDSFEKILMAISWGAITITAVDVILTADVREESGS